ncbi:MAG: HAD family hydrolase [Nanobdellota archaeon]
MIKAIIFDFGNVISRFDNNLFINKISNYTNKSKEELKEIIYFKNNLPVLYESGKLSSQEFFEKITQLCDLNISKKDFIEAYTNKFTPIDSTFDLIKKLKKNYKIGLLSNTSEWDFEFRIKPLPVFRFFDAVSLSYEVKASKPDVKIFKDITKKLNLKPEECVYIDDIKEYSDKAKELGMKAINYTSNPELLKELKSFDIKI